jgi:hypothetical protein
LWRPPFVTVKIKEHLIVSILLATSAARALGQPVISTQPQDQTNYVGTTATFTVVATGTSAITYHWQKYTTAFGDIADQTNATLTLPNVQTNDAADYRVVVTDATGSTNSTAAHLYVSPPERLFISQPAPGLVTLSWQGSMVLLQAGLGSGSLECPAWVRVADTSPVTLPVGSGTQFFRLVALPPIEVLEATCGTNAEACAERVSAEACEDCVSSFLLMAPLHNITVTAAGFLSLATMSAAVGIGDFGSCISASQLPILIYIRYSLEGP